MWALEALCDPLTIGVLARLRLPRQCNCLELGAGRGSIARWLATQCLHGSVLATDTDIHHLRRLREPNLTVVQHDVVDGPEFRQGAFGLIHSRALFTHLPDRDAVLSRVAGWLAPGGWLVVEEPILLPTGALLDPAVGDALTAFEHLMADALGSDFQWARNLPAALRAAGLAEVDVSGALAATSGGGAINEFWRVTLAHLSTDMVDAGLIDHITLRHALDRFNDPDYRDFTMAFVCAWGRSTS
ncbi:class I SAM-dependent methyltransferase [Amycolatopsis alba DSM 44262]|uniref:Class I SAM-dependent methyltransferase n=1 Tax=Amycolatopsis alba DSM 44262 TaxID=1125972 RepID=A0A229RLL5_AMYAL|nr:class I SAM-dependent methyltransferase [Amycolatopsis alba DSM 44262]